MNLPTRKPVVGDIITIMNDNELKGRTGIISWIAEKSSSFYLNTEQSVVICPHKLGKDNIAPPVIYRLYSNNLTYKNK